MKKNKGNKKKIIKIIKFSINDARLRLLNLFKMKFSMKW